MRLRPVLNFLILISMVPVWSSYGDSRKNAIELERQGDIPSARALYLEWLDGNLRHESALDVLIHVTSIADDVIDALGVLGHYSEKLSTADGYEIFARMASLESSLGLPADAAYHYEKAAKAGGVQGERRSMEALSLRFGMGEFAYVARSGASLSERAISPVVKVESLALASLALALAGDGERAVESVRRAVFLDDGYSPLPLLAMADVATITGDAELWNEAAIGLSKTYPSSVASHVVHSRVKRWISPSLLESFPAEPYSGRPVQTGAFQERDGAASQRLELEEDGFTAWIEEQDGLWRVFVNDADGNVRSRLSASGYETSVGR